MNTRKLLLISSDKNLIGIIKTSALTLTKLNCQISVEETAVNDEAIEKSKAVNLNLIILDNDLKTIDQMTFIKEIRKNINSKNKKIISLYTSEINKEEIFTAGCDSIMSKQEFQKVVNNILVI